MYFLALSQAPPALAIKSAIKTHTSRPPASIPPSASAPIPSPTKGGAETAMIPGRSIFLSAAAVAISTHLAVSGSAFPSKRPGISLNCLLISLIISKAASPTAVIVIEAIKKGMAPPIKIPISTIGLDKSSSKGSALLAETVETNAEMIASAASAAAPMANPLPIAAVVFPCSSNSSVITLVSEGIPAISAIPPALSATGPYASIAIVIPTVESIPTAAIPTP